LHARQIISGNQRWRAVGARHRGARGGAVVSACMQGRSSVAINEPVGARPRRSEQTIPGPAA
jgi:hypothetical protein